MSFSWHVIDQTQASHNGQASSAAIGPSHSHQHNHFLRQSAFRRAEINVQIRSLEALTLAADAKERPFKLRVTTVYASLTRKLASHQTTDLALSRDDTTGPKWTRHPAGRASLRAWRSFRFFGG